MCPQGPPANQETKEKSSRMTGCPDNPTQKMKRCENQKRLKFGHSNTISTSVCVCVRVCVYVCVCFLREQLAENSADPLSIQRQTEETHPTKIVQVITVSDQQGPDWT